MAKRKSVPSLSLAKATAFDLQFSCFTYLAPKNLQMQLILYKLFYFFYLRQQWKPQPLSDVIDKQRGMERSFIHRDRSSPSLRMGRSSNENGDGQPAKAHFHLKDQGL
jgi:hypothetical protein